jgi:hypothetical protein
MAKVVRFPKGASSDAGLVETALPPNSGPSWGLLVGGRWSTLEPEVGWARLTADDDPALSVVCELGDGFPAVTDGYGGWDTVDRPHQTSITTWRGFQPIAIDLPLDLDQLATGESIEAAIDVLEALAGRGRLRTGGQPPLVEVHTAGVMPQDAHVFPDLRWVITSLGWDEQETIVNDHGNRVRAPVTVSLLQYEADRRLQDAAFELHEQLTKRREKAGSARRNYTVKQGETLVSIARTHLGDAGRWPEIAALNSLRDPRAIKANAVIRIPRR